MPMQKTKSNLLAKLGDKGRKAHEAHKSDETTYSSGGELPAGIEGGIAQLVECKFDQYKKGDNVGEYFFYAAGVVKSPKEHDGQRIEGLRTSIMEPMHDTPGRSRESVADHIEWVYNELRKLGIDTATMEIDDLETTVAALKEAKPHFRFRTWKGQATEQFPNPRVNHVWNGVTEYVDASSNGHIVDNTEEAGDAEPPEEPEEPETEEPEEGGDEEGGDDLDATIDAAQSGDEDAQRKLMAMAKDLGLKDEAEAESDWEGVGRLIKEAQSSSEGAEETEEEEEKGGSPKKGYTLLYRPIDPKTKKKAKVATEVEVLSVDNKAKTVTVKNLDTGKPVVDPKTKKPLQIKWDDLES